MKQVNHPRCNHTLGANNIPNTEDLRVEITRDPQGFQVTTSFWMPTPEEWEEIRQTGALISVSIMGTQIPPMRIGVATNE